jgi:hypothetical protein
LEFTPTHVPEPPVLQDLIEPSWQTAWAVQDMKRGAGRMSVIDASVVVLHSVTDAKPICSTGAAP